MEVRVINQALPYGMKNHKVGSTVNIEDGHAQMLIAINRVEKAKPAERVVVENPKKKATKKKYTRKTSTYKRRDMKATENDE